MASVNTKGEFTMNSTLWVFPLCVVAVVFAAMSGFVYLVIVIGVAAVAVSLLAVLHEVNSYNHRWDRKWDV